MTTQTPATTEIEKSLRIRVREKNAESCRSRLRIRGHLFTRPIILPLDGMKIR